LPALFANPVCGKTRAGGDWSRLEGTWQVGCATAATWFCHVGCTPDLAPVSPRLLDAQTCHQSLVFGRHETGGQNAQQTECSDGHQSEKNNAEGGMPDQDADSAGIYLR